MLGKAVPIWLLDAIKLSLVLVGPFLIGIGVFIFGLSVFLLVESPARVATDRTNATVLYPQPAEVRPAQTNTIVISPPISAYLNGMATNASVWANGRLFRTRGQAAWYLIKNALWFWLVLVGVVHLAWALKPSRTYGIGSDSAGPGQMKEGQEAQTEVDSVRLERRL